MECAAKGRGSPCEGSPEIRCDRCKAVAYCSLSHQVSHRSDHEEECERLEQQMRNVDVLNEFPFTFSDEATHQVCAKKETRCSFLARRRLHQVGMWSCECSCGAPNVSDNLSRSFKCWNLPKPLVPCIDPVSPLSNQLSSWKEYYEWRSIPFESPVALLLHSPLTLYHAIQLNALRLKSGEDRREINIHYLGPDTELCQLASFGELHALLPYFHLRIDFVGPAVPKRRDGERIILDSYACCDDKDCKCKTLSEGWSPAVTLQLHNGFYHDRFGDIMKHSFPDLIIAPNAGIAAYPSWKETLEMIHCLNVPTVFSDFCEEAATLAAQCLTSITGSQLALPIQINPFRQPLAVEDTALYLPCYSNCFLFGI